MTAQSPDDQVASAFDDVDYPAYTMGRAAEMLGVTPEFLRSLDAAGLLTPDRSAGGHRRYSRTELALAARVRELLDSGLTVLVAACRIVELERDLATAQRSAGADGTP
ncbi:MerR family transcriptional regulator [Saccharopolyspora sp. NPDC002686]|uniref:MerR family transcriptional regulator n=1 Tax=Saccharopolyspora sp. NPDC002686 TaxID=3154541 RepID=UPI0033298C04